MSQSSPPARSVLSPERAFPVCLAAGAAASSSENGRKTPRGTNDEPAAEQSVPHVRLGWRGFQKSGRFLSDLKIAGTSSKRLIKMYKMPVSFDGSCLFFSPHFYFSFLCLFMVDVWLVSPTKRGGHFNENVADDYYFFSPIIIGVFLLWYSVVFAEGEFLLPVEFTAGCVPSFPLTPLWFNPHPDPTPSVWVRRLAVAFFAVIPDAGLNVNLNTGGAERVAMPTTRSAVWPPPCTFFSSPKRSKVAPGIQAESKADNQRHVPYRVHWWSCSPL